MRILFAGTPPIAIPSLEEVCRRFDVRAVLTAPDRETGRGRKQGMPAVKTCADRLGLEVLQPERLDAGVRSRIEDLKPDLLVSVAYGKIFGPKFLSLFPAGGVNLHPSLLPKYRGPSPIPAAICAGDSETGITIQTLALEMDAGDILAQRNIPLSGTETTGSLTETVSILGADLLAEVLERIENGTAKAEKQDEHQATYCRLIHKEDGIIDWNDGTRTIERMIRAYSPWPGAVTTFRGAGLTLLAGGIYSGEYTGNRPGTPGTVLGVDKQAGYLIKTGDGILAVRELKLQARSALDWKSFHNGVKDFIGSVLGGRDG